MVADFVAHRLPVIVAWSGPPACHGRFRGGIRVAQISKQQSRDRKGAHFGATDNRRGAQRDKDFVAQAFLPVCLNIQKSTQARMPVLQVRHAG